MAHSYPTDTDRYRQIHAETNRDIQRHRDTQRHSETYDGASFHKALRRTSSHRTPSSVHGLRVRTTTYVTEVVSMARAGDGTGWGGNRPCSLAMLSRRFFAWSSVFLEMPHVVVVINAQLSQASYRTIHTGGTTHVAKHTHLSDIASS